MYELAPLLQSGSNSRVCTALASRTIKLFALLATLSFTGGCATTSTLSQPAHERKPLVMSGVRLDLASSRNEAAVTERFGVSPPSYPLMDLPFSAALDLMVLGYTVPVALFYRQ